MKKTVSILLSCFALCSALALMSNSAPQTESLDSETRYGSNEPRAFTQLSLEISGGNGEVVATATNTFTLLVSTEQVYVELYYSSTYTTDYETMTMPTMAYTPDLDMGHSLSVDAKTNGEQRYWLARVRYNENGSGWQEIITGPVLLDANGNAV